MRFSSALLLCLATSAIAAKPKLSDSWEIDDSCDAPRLEKLEDAHSEIVELLTKVTRDLAHVQQPRPATRWGKTNWNRISGNLAGLFGLQPSDAIMENGYDPSEQYFSQVLYTYDRMYQALVKGRAVPGNGYSGKLGNQNQPSKPLLLCGDTRAWEFFDKDAKYKYDKSKTVAEVFPDAAKAGGAFIRANRYLGATPVRDGGKVVNGTDLDRDHFGRQSLVRVMLHEFAHYYGSRMEGSEFKGLPDQQAVDTNACLLWTESTGKQVREPTTAGGQNLPRQVVYSLRFCTNLNIDQTANAKTGKFEKDGALVAGTLGTTGPSVATWTAETYAYFPIISYLDKWEWVKTGKARPLPKA
ncbi:hypothetical protein F25303_14139 [Fusarium sp. NRRL 25303]|nr:hypothetical protein F25303_14139 [Fusarium sp. NRRL 25303]